MIDHYEVLVIFPGSKTEEEVQPLVSRLEELLKIQGANITKTDFWGKRKLAYEIDGYRHGFYHLVEFDLESTKLNDLDKALQLSDDVVRHQVVRRIVKSAAAVAKAEALRERIAAKRQAAKEKEAAAMVTEAAPVQATPVEPAAPVAQEKLAEKLEEILESDKVDL